MLSLIATLTLAMMVTLATARLVGPAFGRGWPVIERGPGLPMVALGLAAAIGPSILLGPLFGAGLFVALGMFFVGRNIGHRLAADVRAEDDLAAFVASVTGPAILLAPMALCYIGAEHLAETAPQTARLFGHLALGFGAIGLLALLPLWPLPGGQALAVLTRAMRPGLERVVSWAMIWSVTLFAVAHGLVLVGALGALAGCMAIVLPLRRPYGADPVPLPRGSRLMAWGAFLAMFAAFAISGWWMLALLLLM